MTPIFIAFLQKLVFVGQQVGQHEETVEWQIKSLGAALEININQPYKNCKCYCTELRRWQESVSSNLKQHTLRL